MHRPTVCTAPQDVCLASCVFDGEGLSQCIAGQAATFKIRAYDFCGYAVGTGSADFTLCVLVAGKETAGAHPRHASSQPEVTLSTLQALPNRGQQQLRPFAPRLLLANAVE